MLQILFAVAIVVLAIKVFLFLVRTAFSTAKLLLTVVIALVLILSVCFGVLSVGIILASIIALAGIVRIVAGS